MAKKPTPATVISRGLIPFGALKKISTLLENALCKMRILDRYNIISSEAKIQMHCAKLRR
jgi:hypothetical protein